MFSAIKEFLYQKGVWHPVRLPAYVVSVGNVSFGGTGKSPFSMLLAEKALQSIPVALLSRGYKRKLRAMRVVAADEDPPGPSEIGDEPWMMKNRIRSLALLVHRDRVRMALRHWRELGAPKLVVLDDAFQHWKAYRNFDVVMVDAFEFLHGRKFLGGREPWSSLGRADLVVVNRADSVSGEDLRKVLDRVRLYCSQVKKVPWKKTRTRATTILTARYVVDSYWDALRGQNVEKPLDKKFVLISGIAKPESFRFTARNESLDIVEEIYFSDHHFLSAKEEGQILEKVRRNPDYKILVNEKDWARWHPFFQKYRIPVVVLRVRLSFPDSDQEQLEKIFSEIIACSTSG